MRVQTTIEGKGPLPEARSLQLIKASHYRSELISSLGRTITLYDTREGKGAVLREFGAQKIMTPISRANWIEITQDLAEARFEISGEQKEILGEVCFKAIALLKDSTTLEVFFTRDLVNDNPELFIQFRNLPGLALQYATRKGSTTVSYTATSISFDPVAIQKFDIPNSGYRILDFEESKKKQ